MTTIILRPAKKITLVLFRDPFFNWAREVRERVRWGREGRVGGWSNSSHSQGEEARRHFELDASKIQLFKVLLFLSANIATPIKFPSNAE
jgi:hypothetical protein